MCSLPQRWPQSGEVPSQDTGQESFGPSLHHFSPNLPVKPSGCLGRELLSRLRRKGFQGFEYLLACAPDLKPQNSRYEPGPFSSCSGREDIAHSGPHTGGCLPQASFGCWAASLPNSDSPVSSCQWKPTHPSLPMALLPLPGAAPCIRHCSALLPYGLCLLKMWLLSFLPLYPGLSLGRRCLREWEAGQPGIDVSQKHAQAMREVLVAVFRAVPSVF